LPQGHAARPAERDLRTNCIRSDVSDEEHAAAYLQFDVHAIWIVEFFLLRHGCRVSEVGLCCKCYSRFDDALGAPETVTLYRDDIVLGVEAPAEMAVYNYTGDEFAGVHYDPVFLAAEVPPPPPPLAGVENSRPRMRQKGSYPERATTVASASSPQANPLADALPDVASEAFYRIKA